MVVENPQKGSFYLDPLFSNNGYGKRGSIVINSENRRNVILRNRDLGRSTTISYARYMMSVKLGRFLTKDEIVDHIDGDHTNDSYENLQIISKRDNTIKGVLQNRTSSIYCKIKCGVCDSIFYRRRGKTYNKRNFCSRACLYEFLRKKGQFKDSEFLEEFRLSKEDYLSLTGNIKIK